MKHLIVLILSVFLSGESFAQSKGNTQGGPQVFSKGKSQDIPEFVILGDTMRIVFDETTYEGIVNYQTSVSTVFYYSGKKDNIQYTTYSMLDESSVFIKRVNGIAVKVQLWKQNLKQWKPSR